MPRKNKRRSLREIEWLLANYEVCKYGQRGRFLKRHGISKKHLDYWQKHRDQRLEQLTAAERSALKRYRDEVTVTAEVTQYSGLLTHCRCRRSLPIAQTAVLADHTCKCGARFVIYEGEFFYLRDPVKKEHRIEIIKHTDTYVEVPERPGPKDWPKGTEVKNDLLTGQMIAKLPCGCQFKIQAQTLYEQAQRAGAYSKAIGIISKWIHSPPCSQAVKPMKSFAGFIR